MDEGVANQLARELADAIAAAVAADARVEACHARARQIGVELKVVLATEARPLDPANPAPAEGTAHVVAEARATPAFPPPEGMSAADRRFLRALRISAGHPPSGR